MSGRTMLSLPSPAYNEESVRIPVAVTLLLLILISAPLVLWILRINAEGSLATSTAKYDALVSTVQTDVLTVDALLRNDAEELESIRVAHEARMDALIVPEVVVVEEEDDSRKVRALKVSLDGIYWNLKNPLVSIGNETYRVGDLVQGYEIVRIDKTAVQFQAPDGTLVVKDMYENIPNIN